MEVLGVISAGQRSWLLVCECFGGTAVNYSLIPQSPFPHRSYSGNRDNVSSIMAKEGHIAIP